MKNIELTNGLYAAKWWLTDFYPESEQRLRDALASGEDFYTSYGCKKEIDYCEIQRHGDTIAVSATAYMDNLWESNDLIYDALWERTRVEDYEFSNEMINRIREAAIDEQLDDCSQIGTTIPASSSFEQLCDAIDKMEDEARAANDGMYRQLCNIVEDHYKYATEQKRVRKENTPC